MDCSYTPINAVVTIRIQVFSEKNPNMVIRGISNMKIAYSIITLDNYNNDYN